MPSLPPPDIDPGEPPSPEPAGRHRWLILGLAGLAVAGVIGAVAAGEGSDDGSQAATATTVPSPTSPLPESGDLRVFLEVGVTTSQLDQIRDELESDPVVTDVEFVDDEAARAEFAATLPDEAPPGPGVLPTSFIVDLDGDAAEITALIDRIEQRNGVREATVGPRAEAPTVSQPVVPRGDVLVFFDPTASASQIEAVGSLLEASALVAGIDFQDQDEALEEFQHMFADEPVLLATVEADQLPPSFGVTAAGVPSATLAFACGLQSEPGVREVAGIGRGCPSA